MTAADDRTTAPGAARPATIGLIGAGWRAEYFLRIAEALPDRFEIATVLVRSERSAAAARERWSVSATTSLAEFLRGRYDYVIVSTPAEAAADLVVSLVAAGVPVLAETPPATGVDELVALYDRVGGAPVQVAEQYHLQPAHAARLAVAASGLIGEVTSTRVSAAHGYHGLSLARRALGLGSEGVRVTAQTVPDRVLSARGREGWKPQLVEVDNPRTVALLRFESGAAAVFDFAEEQYFSPVRARHFSVRGTRGEVDDDHVDYLLAPGRAVHSRLVRDSTGIDGDLDGSHLRGITLNETTVYENRFAPARLGDDELAVAELMHRMAGFVETGANVYSLAEASHDQYLALLVQRAAEDGSETESARMPWTGWERTPG